MSDPRATPAMQQYSRFKKRHPDCVLLFRIGDFYEMFDEDATAVSRAIGLTLTQRSEGVPMCGVPFHQLEVYLSKLMAHGFRVAVCEQLQEAKQAKGIIERAVTRVLTPGTLVEDALVESGSSARLAGVAFGAAGEASPAGVAVVDLSDGGFALFDCAAEALPDELARRSVTELVYADTADGVVPPRVGAVLGGLTSAGAAGVSGTPQPPWFFRASEAAEALCRQFGVATLDGFGLGVDEPAVRAAGALVRYLVRTQRPGAEADAGGRGSGDGTAPARLEHLRPPKREPTNGWLIVDATSLRSLEVLRAMRAPAGGGEAAGSLLGVFLGGGGGRGCRTPMGKRLLRDWLCRPLALLPEIERRQRCVATLAEGRATAEQLGACLQRVQDVPRIAARVALGRATPRDLVGLGRSLMEAGGIAGATENAPALREYHGRAEAVRSVLAPLAGEIAAMCVDSPPGHLREGGLVRDGADAALDQCRLLERDAASWLAEYQRRLIEEHKLPGIKVGYNRVFGYFIELSKAQARSAPASFVRRQTLTGAERYVTPELREFEDKATHARARALERENAIFAALCARAREALGPIGDFAALCAELDVLACFADKAVRGGWVRPEIVAEPVLEIVQGRHPVLDELLGAGFVPNDAHLRGGGGPAGRAAAGAAPSLALITGPNMAGKSTFIRQTALLTLLAHVGAFVPAERAVIGLTDRIFTRVGADDALHAGQSTFMVEMTETARILHHATERSLVILDEIGRGTGTLDGLSLAWAIAETLAGLGARTLFATHYHELTALAERLPGAVGNLHVAVREWGDSVVFLHRIEPGRTGRSYGIHVARLAGLPETTLRRAREMLESLSVRQEGGEAQGGAPHPARHAPAPGAASLGVGPPAREDQLALFGQPPEHPALAEIRELKLEALSPLQAFDLLRRIRESVRPPGEGR
ncbi:MAG TPA: DNA mismatch repair protein MutS [Phycisphaerales bacterium]|nr:DNA mismatch repair protein MutS [Phycisphaerales bacterium]